MICSTRALFFTLLFAAAPVHAVGPNNNLNDTGVTLFGDATSNALTKEPVTHPGQDASFGRDAAAKAGALAKVGAGAKGFDFTKIANNGTALSAGASLGTASGAWGCTYDNVTGLLWEVKVSDPSHLRYMSHSYTWYDANPATNGGDAGTSSGGSCRTSGRCNTEKFVQDVNSAGLCGHSDWRLPSVGELASIVDYGIASPGPTIETGYFPNTPGSYFWSASANAYYSGYAWNVNFNYGDTGNSSKYNILQVRLVRAGQ